MARAILGLILATALLALVYANSEAAPGGKRTLAILEDLTIKKTHSKFFSALTARGHEVTYVRASDSSLAIHKFGESLYDNIILFAPTEAINGGVDARTIIEFVDNGGNLFLAGAQELSDTNREIAAECGLEFDETKSVVIDHLNFAADDEGDHTLILTDNVISNPVIVGSKKLNAIKYRGVGMAVAENPLVIKVLTGSSTSYTYNPEVQVKDNPIAIGKNTVLVAGLQARNNARVVISGSLELFSDSFFAATAKGAAVGNEDFAVELAKWVFQEKGVLRADSVKYNKVDSTESRPSSIRIKDFVEYSVRINEWNGKSWVPFKSDNVQLEFVMLDPYERVNLKSTGNGVFSTRFQVPDVYGIFQFILRYEQPGYSRTDIRDQISVLPFKHNEYERFIVAAYPYYASAFSMLGSFFIFGLFFLYGGKAGHKSKSD